MRVYRRVHRACRCVDGVESNRSPLSRYRVAPPRPAVIPFSPQTFYADDGWEGWAHWFVHQQQHNTIKVGAGSFLES